MGNDTWEVHGFGCDALEGASGYRAAAGVLVGAGGRRCAVVEASREVSSSLARMVEQSRVRDDGYRASLDALGGAQSSLLREIGGEAGASLAARVEGDVRDLADILHAIRTAGFREETRDLVTAYASLWSAYALAAALGATARLVDARDVLVAQPFVSEGEACVEWEPSREAARSVFDGTTRVVVVPGGVAATPDEGTTALGRSGVDHSVAAFAALLGSAEAVRWSGEGGVFTADPAAVPGAHELPTMTFATAGALSAGGHPALQPVAWGPLIERGIPLTLRDLRAPERPGTRLVVGELAPRVEALATVAPAALVHLRGRGVGVSSSTLRALFAALHELASVPFGVVFATGAQGLTLVLRDAECDAVAARLVRLFAWEGRSRVVQSVESERGVAMVALGGGDGVSLRMALGALADSGVTVRAAAQAEASGVVVALDDVSRALRALHRAYELG